MPSMQNPMQRQTGSLGGMPGGQMGSLGGMPGGQGGPMQQSPFQQLQGMSGMLGGQGGPMQQLPNGPMQRPPTLMGGAITPNTTFSGQGGPMQQLQGMGFDPQAVAANPGDFFKYMQGMQAQESRMPGSTMMSQPQGGKGGMPGGQGGPMQQNPYQQLQGMAGSLGGMPGGDRISSLPPQLQQLQRRIQEQNFMRGAPQQGGQGLAGLMGSQQSSTNSLK